MTFLHREYNSHVVSFLVSFHLLVRPILPDLRLQHNTLRSLHG